MRRSTSKRQPVGLRMSFRRKLRSPGGLARRLPSCCPRSGRQWPCLRSLWSRCLGSPCYNSLHTPSNKCLGNPWSKSLHNPWSTCPGSLSNNCRRSLWSNCPGSLGSNCPGSPGSNCLHRSPRSSSSSLKAPPPWHPFALHPDPHRAALLAPAVRAGPPPSPAH